MPIEDDDLTVGINAAPQPAPRDYPTLTEAKPERRPGGRSETFRKAIEKAFERGYSTALRDVHNQLVNLRDSREV